MHFRNARPASSSRPSNSRRESNRARLFSDALESRLLLAITQNVVVGGTLDIFPISSIFPSGPYTAMEVQATTVPHTQYGNMYRTDGVSEFIWGSGAPNAFNPNGTANRIFSGQGFRYKHTGTVAGVQESIPIRFRDSTGFNTLTDTLIINVTSPVGAPQITQQPQGLTSVATGGTATLSVVATGNAPLSYQWFTGLSPNTQFPISGATSSTYTTPPLTPSPIGLDYQYWVRVSNGVGSAASVTATVKVGAVPTANAGGPYNATEGGTVQLTGSGTDPNNGLYLVFEWDLDGDNLFNETGTGALNGNENVQNPIFTARNGPVAQPIKLRTTNDRGLSTVANSTVNIANVAPSNIAANAPTSIGHGQAFNLTGSFADPGTLDAHTVTINWGDGSPNTVLNLPAGQLTYSTTKTYGVSYGLNSNYTINVAVADDVTSANVNRAIAVTRNNQFVVTTTADEDNGTADAAFGGGTSLREALRYAEAAGGVDTITFAPALANQTISLSSGWNNSSDDTLLRVIGDVVINAGNAITLKPATGSTKRLFLSSGGTFTLRNVTINDADTRGFADGGALWTNGAVVLDNVRFNNNKATNGGAVMNFGVVNIVNSTFTGNVANSEGGAIASGGTTIISGSTFFQNSAALGAAINSAGTLTVGSSTFSTNTASFNGGALRLYSTASISTSTLSNNTAANGGGGLISHGSTTLTNVTIANNTALDGGGAQFFEGSATLRHVTIARNTATRSGGGVAVNSADVTITNTIIAGNTGVDQNDVWGSAFNAASANNLLNLSATAAGLGTLASNGGSTQTILPLNGSPAIDAGVAIAGVPADQRGTARGQFEFTDIGAVEVTRADLNLQTWTTGGALWFLGAAVLPNGDRRVYREVSGSATWINGGTAVRMGLSVDGTVVVQNSVGNVFYRPGTNAGTGSSWVLTTTTTGNGGQTWLLGPELNGATNDRFIYRWPTAGQLTSAGGAGTTLQNFGGVIWTKTTNGLNWRYISDGNWQAVSAPGILAANFDSVARQAVTLLMTDEGRPFYTRDDITIRNQTTSQTIAAGTIAWNPSGTQATIDLTNQLPDGNYIVQVGATTFGSFFVLKGDFNRDRTVNFDDLLVLAANYNTSGANNSQGDATYDGNINFDDLLAMAANYNTSRPAAAPAGIGTPPPSSGGSGTGDEDPPNDPATVL